MIMAVQYRIGTSALLNVNEATESVTVKAKGLADRHHCSCTTCSHR